MTPLSHNPTSNLSASLIDFCFEMNQEFAHFSSPRCHPTISHLDDCSSLLPALPVFSLTPTPPLQPLLPVQIEESYWTKVRPHPFSAQHPLLAPTGVLTMVHRALHDLVPITPQLISSPRPRTLVCRHNGFLLLLSQAENAPPAASAGPMPGTLFSQIAKCVSPSFPQASTRMSPHPDHTIQIPHSRPELGPGEVSKAPGVQDLREHSLLGPCKHRLPFRTVGAPFASLCSWLFTSTLPL